MQSRVIQFFTGSAAGLLLATAGAKFFSGTGNARVLETADPILGLSLRCTLWVAAAAELLVALNCLFGKRVRVQAVLLAWLATSILLYRLGLLWIGYRKPCNCLGYLTDIIHISPQAADTIMKATLTYLLIGSYATLAWLWRQSRRTKNEAV